jgi:NADH-quinone oxidoreductase subunit M
MPVYATITLIIFLASMGLPLLNGFIGEAMILLGAYAANKVWAYWAVLGIVLGAAYLLWLYQRVFWGPITHEENRTLPDLNGRELATLVPLVVLCFWIGVYPKPFLAFLHRPMGQLAATIQPGKFLGAGGGAVHAAPRGSFPERNESLVVRPEGAPVAPAAPPERTESIVVQPSPSPR